MGRKRVLRVPGSGQGGAAAPLLGVEKEGLLWVQGLSAAPRRPGGAAAPEVGGQMRDILAQLDQVLGQVGGRPRDVMKTVDFLLPAGLPSYRGTADVRRAYFQEGHFPASTGVLMEAQPQQGALLGVDVIAHVGPGERRQTTPTEARAQGLTFRAGVEKGGILWLSGTTGRRLDAAGAEVYPPDLATQVEIIYDKQLQVLRELGYTYAEVVKTVDYFTAAALPAYRQTAEIRRRVFGSTFPVSTGVGVNRLLRPEALIEIDMVAVKGKREVINPGWDYSRLTYVPGIRVNNLLFLAGFAAHDPLQRRLVGVGDLAAQAAQAYQQVAAVVEAAGGGLADVVKVVEYLAPAAVAQMERLPAVRRRFLEEGGYALSQTVVQRLVQPEMLIEVEAVAILG